eukprot:537978-Prymnesium_polylepis.2
MSHEPADPLTNRTPLAWTASRCSRGQARPALAWRARRHAPRAAPHRTRAHAYHAALDYCVTSSSGLMSARLHRSWCSCTRRREISSWSGRKAAVK